MERRHVVAVGEGLAEGEGRGVEGGVDTGVVATMIFTVDPRGSRVDTPGSMATVEPGTPDRASRATTTT